MPKRLKRQRDPIQLGKLVVDIATGQVEIDDVAQQHLSFVEGVTPTENGVETASSASKARRGGAGRAAQAAFHVRYPNPRCRVRFG
jgi:hypothetical protein